MPITPKNLNPAANPVQLEVNSANNIEQIGVYASLSFSINAAFNVNTSIELNLLGEVMHFDFVAAPDNTGFQLRGWNGGQTFTEWWDEFILSLKANYYINEFYQITDNAVNSYLSIQARELGSTYNIDVEDPVPANVINKTVVLSQSEIKKANFGIHARVIDAETKEVLGEDRIAGNKAIFDFSEYLKNWVQSGIFFPEGNGYPQAQNSAVKEFYITHYEKASGYFSKVTRTENYKAICGGINKTHEQLIQAGVTDYLQLFKSGDILVQHSRPLFSKCSLNQPLHFYIINNLGAAKIFTPIVTLHYTDGATHIMDLDMGIAAKEWEQAIFHLSPVLHDFASLNEDEEISYFTVKIQTNTGEETELFQFNIEDSPQEQFLCIKNSQGTYDFITFFGINEIVDKYKRITFENSNNEISLIDVKENETLVLASGWVSKEERDWFRDLLQSRAVKIVNGDLLEPYVITTGESLRHKDNEYLYGLIIKLQRSVSDSNYSKERNAIPDAQTSGFVIGTDDYIIGTDEYDLGF